MSNGIRPRYDHVVVIERDKLIASLASGLAYAAAQIISHRPDENGFFHGGFKIQVSGVTYDAWIHQVNAVTDDYLELDLAYQPGDQEITRHVTVQIVIGLSDEQVANYESNDELSPDELYESHDIDEER